MKTELTQEEIIEGNRIIADFETGTPRPEGWHYLGMQYHKSYDWLIPVYDKYRTMSVPIPHWQMHEANIADIGKWLNELNLTSMWEELVDAIKWYNSIKP